MSPQHLDLITDSRSGPPPPFHACLQTKDKWGFPLTARYDMYAQFFNDYLQPGFNPQVIRDPSLA